MMINTSDLERRWGVHLLLAGLFLVGLAGEASAQESLTTILQKADQALGSAHLEKFQITGQGEQHGLKTRFIYCFGANGAFRVESRSALGEIYGFNGKRGWKVDSTGMPGHIENKMLIIHKITSWVLGGYWLHGDRPMGITLEEESEDWIRLKLTVNDTPLHAKLVICKKQYLPIELSYLLHGDKNSVYYEDYRECSGRMIPYKITHKGKFECDTVLIDGVKALGEEALKLCQPVVKRPADTRFDPDFKGAIQVKKTFTSHILVRPKINGRDLGWFFLDTGAGRSVINTKTAKKLGLPPIGQVKVTGMGGSVKSCFCRAETLELGPFTQMNPFFVQADLEFCSKIFKCEIAGALGYDLLSRCGVKMDMKTPEVQLHEPGAWKHKKAPWMEIIFDNNIPSVYGRMEGNIQGLFHLDTGSNDTVQFHGGFVKKHRLLEGREVRESAVGGVGGSNKVFLGKIEYFKLGEAEFKNPPVIFTKGGEGLGQDETSAGNIGNGFLSKFTLLIDYPSKRIAFVPNKAKKS